MSEENQIKPKHDTNRMGTAPIGRTLAAMSWPAILSMSVNALYNVVDSIFVSKYDPLALTAVSLVMPIQLIMVAFTVGSGVGVNSVISRRLGAKNYEDANKAASISVRIGIFNYLIFLLIGVIITHVVEELPALSAANRFCGMLLGLAGGMVVIWIFMIVASFVFGAAYDSMIAQNEILALIDQNNLVLYLLTKL